MSLATVDLRVQDWAWTALLPSDPVLLAVCGVCGVLGLVLTGLAGPPRRWNLAGWTLPVAAALLLYVFVTGRLLDLSGDRGCDMINVGLFASRVRFAAILAALFWAAGAWLKRGTAVGRQLAWGVGFALCFAVASQAMLVQVLATIDTDLAGARNAFWLRVLALVVGGSMLRRLVSVARVPRTVWGMAIVLAGTAGWAVFDEVSRHPRVLLGEPEPVPVLEPSFPDVSGLAVIEATLESGPRANRRRRVDW